jgi:hypothetical protein
MCVEILRMSCSTISQNFEMFSGDTLRVIAEVRDEAGLPVSVAGATIQWRLAQSPSSAALVSKSTADSTVLTTVGGFYFDILPADTAALDGRYYHEAQVVTSTGAVYTVMAGYVRVRPDLIA